jgi:type II secretory pathway component PulC
MNALRLILNVASLALVVMIGWLVVRSVLGLLRPDSLMAPAIVVAPSPSASVVATRSYDFSSDPFNLDAPEVVVETPDPGADAPETTLDLELRGTTTGANGGATMLLPDGKQVRVPIDGEVMNNVTLTGISAGFVTLNVGGQTQRLSLDRGNSGLIKTSEEVELGADMPTTLSVKAKTPIPSASTVNADMSDFLARVRIDPYRENGQTVGYQVEARSGTDLSAYGLLQGDIITRLGAVELSGNRVDFRQVRRVLESAQSAGGLDVTLLRNGQPLQLRMGQ